MNRIIPGLAVLCVFGCAEPQDAALDGEPIESEPMVQTSADITAAPSANPADVESIDAIIKAYYDVVSGPAGEIPDKSRDLSLHHPDHWIAIANTSPEGVPFIRTMDLDGYYGDLQPRAEGFYEWETEREVRQYKNMATVWSHFASSRTEGGEITSSGVNTITLWFDGTRWWVMNWMYDSSR